MCNSDYCIVILTDFHFLLCRVVDLEKLNINTIIIKFFPVIFNRYNFIYKFLLRSGLLSINYTIEYGCKVNLPQFQKALSVLSEKNDSRIYFFCILISGENCSTYSVDTKLISI
jgi:hypothetical protein